MGQKVSPVGLRVGVNRDWSSRWYADKKDFSGLLHEDIKVRNYITNKLKGAQVHSSIILPEADLNTYKKLGIDVTEEPVSYAKKLYIK